MAVAVVSFAQIADWFDNTSPRSITGLAWSSGDVVVVFGAKENAINALGTPSNANLTFTLQASQTDGGSGEAPVWIWTAVAGSAQSSQTIQVTTAGTQQWGICVWVLSGASGSFANASNNRTESGFTFTPSAGSGVIYGFADWNADTASQTIATGTGTATERVDIGNGTNYGVYAGDWMGVTAGSTTFGVTSYTGLQIGHAALEILASGAAVADSSAYSPARLPGRIGPDRRVYLPGRRFDNNGVVAEVTGTAAETQDDQTSAAVGVLGYSGTVAETQDDQTSTATGQLGYTGTSARTQADQTSTATGQLGYTGTVAEIQDDQTSTASGTVSGPGAITGTLAETQDNQTSTAIGVLGYTGTSARIQANQVAAASGWILVTGTSSRTQADQTSTASGTVTVPPVTGTLAETQANQTALAVGWITVTGTLARTQGNQTATAAGFVGDIPVIPDDLRLALLTQPSTLVAIPDPTSLLALPDPAALAAMPATTGLVALPDQQTLTALED